MTPAPTPCTLPYTRVHFALSTMVWDKCYSLCFIDDRAEFRQRSLLAQGWTSVRARFQTQASLASIYFTVLSKKRVLCLSFSPLLQRFLPKEKMYWLLSHYLQLQCCGSRRFELSQQKYGPNCWKKQLRTSRGLPVAGVIREEPRPLACHYKPLYTVTIFLKLNASITLINF